VSRYRIALLALVVLLLCAVSFLIGSVLSPAEIHVDPIQLPDGRTIYCIVSDAGGVNCDWTFVN
jgi:hypothetical protein